MQPQAPLLPGFPRRPEGQGAYHVVSFLKDRSKWRRVKCRTEGAESMSPRLFLLPLGIQEFSRWKIGVPITEDTAWLFGVMLILSYDHVIIKQLVFHIQIENLKMYFRPWKHKNKDLRTKDLKRKSKACLKGVPQKENKENAEE